MQPWLQATSKLLLGTTQFLSHFDSRRCAEDGVETNSATQRGSLVVQFKRRTAGGAEDMDFGSAVYLNGIRPV